MRLSTILRRRSQFPVTPEMARLKARAAHLRGEIFYLRPAYTQQLRWELAGLERRMQEMEASAARA
ncbi:hypothetical protein [Streptacidiphilus jiangxiensis]|uniref:Uncharacterized protein n=1 Tax=Streptacidiphilus jiangxiensis TaxID=235985 RepID=A0A1H7YXM5_STRJI|nr:hypothetical protein [Streptacidiphilus jiangxiensis]SEM50037.1 hypothetical protein SAMN05414137_1314 [Streptacidiphilus jiangxiensis]